MLVTTKVLLLQGWDDLFGDYLFGDIVVVFFLSDIFLNINCCCLRFRGNLSRWKKPWNTVRDASWVLDISFFLSHGYWNLIKLYVYLNIIYFNPKLLAWYMMRHSCWKVWRLLVWRNICTSWLLQTVIFSLNVFIIFSLFWCAKWKDKLHVISW